MVGRHHIFFRFGPGRYVCSRDPMIDLHCAQIKKSDDLDNDGAKSRVLQVLLAQLFAMSIIATLGVRRGEQRERGTSGRCLPSPAHPGSANP
jgi:hypothetical protein